MTDKVAAIFQRIGYSMRMQRIMRFTATEPHTKYEMLLEARQVRPLVDDHAIKVLIGKLIALRFLKPLGSRKSKAGLPREVPRYVLSERGATVLREI